MKLFHGKRSIKAVLETGMPKSLSQGQSGKKVFCSTTGIKTALLMKYLEKKWELSKTRSPFQGLLFI